MEAGLALLGAQLLGLRRVEGVIGRFSELDAEEFPRNPGTIAEGSVVTLDVTSSGASGITIHLELDAD